MLINNHTIAFRLVGLSIVLALSGCMKLQDSSSRALDDVGSETANTWNKLRETLDLSKPKPKARSMAQPRYCYRAFEDVICYRRPIAGQESRLLAYQDGGSVGYTFAEREPDDNQMKRHRPTEHKVEHPVSDSTDKKQVILATPTPTQAPAVAPGASATPTLPPAPVANQPAASQSPASQAAPTTPAPTAQPAAAQPAATQAPTVQPTAATTPAAAAKPAPGTPGETKKASEKKLKEIIFDPDEMNPKVLVPDKLQ